MSPNCTDDSNNVIWPLSFADWLTCSPFETPALGPVCHQSGSFIVEAALSTYL